MNRARRVDINQPNIVKRAKEDGWSVTHTYTLGAGFPDLFVSKCFKVARKKVWAYFLVEIKQPGEKLTEPEIKWHALNKGCVEIIHSPAEFSRIAKRRVAQCLPANTPSS